MSTIILNREGASLLVDAALSAVSKDDVTPVICGAHVSVEDGKVRVTATDRYRIHTALIEAKDIEGEPEAIIPRVALEWLAKNRSYFGNTLHHHHRIRIDIGKPVERALKTEPGALSIVVMEHESDAAASVAWNGRHTLGNFPPVMRLIDTARDAEAVVATPLLRMDFMGRVNRLTRWRGNPVRVKFTAGTKPNKPGPVYFSVEHDGKVVAEALLQPHLEPGGH